MVPVDAEVAVVEDPEPQPDSRRIESATTNKAQKRGEPLVPGPPNRQFMEDTSKIVSGRLRELYTPKTELDVAKDVPTSRFDAIDSKD